MSPASFLRLLLPLLALLLALRPAPVRARLLVIYVDAMRWDYVHRRLSGDALSSSAAGGLLLMRRLGAYVRRVRPVFPTQCLPNIHTAFTGRLPRYHGVLGNRMYDAHSGFHFDYQAATGGGVDAAVNHFDAAPRAWWRPRAEPLWDTVARRSGRGAIIYHLPSVYELQQVARRQRRRREEEEGEAGGEGCPPHEVRPYRRGLRWPQFRQSVLEAIGRLRRNATDLAVVYSDALDRAGHTFGPYSRHVDQTMADLDELLHLVLREVTLDPLPAIHVLLMSDHGMQTISQAKVVHLEWFVLRSRIEKIVNDGSIAGVWPKENYKKDVYARLMNGENSGFSVFWRDDPKIELYFGQGPEEPRMPPIVVVADSGYVLVTNDFPFPRRPELHGAFPQVGLHGYHPTHEDMHTAMLAFGPKIAPGAELPELNITDVYELMCRLLALPARPHNGSAGAVSPLLRSWRLAHAADASAAPEAAVRGVAGPGGPCAPLLLLPLVAARLALV